MTDNGYRAIEVDEISLSAFEIIRAALIAALNKFDEQGYWLWFPVDPRFCQCHKGCTISTNISVYRSVMLVERTLFGLTNKAAQGSNSTTTISWPRQRVFFQGGSNWHWEHHPAFIAMLDAIREYANQTHGHWR